MNPIAQAKMRSIFPGAPDWLRYSEKQRQQFLEIQIGLYRYSAYPDAVNMALADFGYSNYNDYWRDRLSEPMRAKVFINLMILQIMTGKGESMGPARLYEQAFDLAQDMGEGWFFDGPRHRSLMVRPLEAAKWLQSLPQQMHLVPPSLAAFITGEQQPFIVTLESKPALKHISRRPGRPPFVIKKCTAAMKVALDKGALKRSVLSEMTWKEMARYFGGKRHTLMKARDIVLSEFDVNSICDKSSTNDN